MKRFRSSKIIHFIFVGLLIISCQDDDDAPIGEPFDKAEGLSATGWVIDEAFLVDESSPNKAEFNISEFYVSTDNKLEIKFDINGEFEVTPGDGLNFFPDQGTWSFDDPFAPREIIIVDENGVQTIAPLGGPTRITDSQLKINFAKRSCDDDGELKSVLGYRLVFNRKS